MARASNLEKDGMMQHFNTLREIHDHLGWAPPLHPMFSITPFGEAADGRAGCSGTGSAISGDCYLISIKRLIKGEVFYGRTRYDFTHGTMKFMGPGQRLEWVDVEIEPWGYCVIMHKDYVRGYDIESRIRKYGFFSYAANEALHLSPREEETALSIFRAIEGEYRTNPDEFSKEIILAHLDTLLKYADRFYKRQFTDRKALNSELSERFEAILREYFESDRFAEDGTPGIDWIADRLSLSSRYLSDTLKAETGKTAKEHIHLFLIDTAKSLLLSPGMTVSETAYRLGFEYPQYFSRLFRKKTGMSPRQYQTENAVQ